MPKFLKNNFHLILVFVLSIPAVLALFHKGFYGASDDLHIAWLYEMDKIIKLGQIPPRFVPDLSFAFGYPLFNFVFPLPFYIGEIIHLLGFSLVDSVKAVFGLSLILSGTTMYFFLKEILSKDLSLLGALVFIYTPYRSTDVYIRGAIGESLSFVFLPLILYSVIKIYKTLDLKQTPTFRSITSLSLGLAGLVLSHNIVSYMFAPFLLLFIIFLSFTLPKNKARFLFLNLLGIILGLLISVFFWLPAILDSTLMSYSTVFDFIDHFPALKQLITPYFGYGASVPGPYDGMSFFMGILNLVFIATGIITAGMLWKKITKLEKALLFWSLIVLLVSIFMMNFRSTFLWKNLPLLPYFQFPWRFLTMTTLVSVVFLIPFTKIKKMYFKYIIFIAIAGTLFINSGFFRPHDFLERQDSYYTNRYIPYPQASSEYLLLQEEYLRLPKETITRPDKNYPLISSSEKLIFTVIKTDNLNSTIAINTLTDQLVSYNKYFFPGWRAKIDDKEVSLTAGKPYGQITFQVPKGEHTLKISFTETPFKIVLDIIAGITFVTVIYLYVRNPQRT